MKRRGFFQSIAKAAAIIALAPPLAFRVSKIAPGIESLSPVDTEYACVMEKPTAEHVLHSYTWTAEVEIPESQRHWIENY